MERKKTKDGFVVVRYDNDRKKKVHKKAKREKTNVSRIVTEALDEYINEVQDVRR